MINQNPVDRFTLLHAGSGFVAGRLGLPPALAIGGALLFELLEDGWKTQYPRAFPNPSHDSKENALVDVLAFVAAFYAGRRL